MKDFHVTQDARFTEEVLVSGELKEHSDFDVVVNKNCRERGRHPQADFVKGTDVCYHCYYRELAKMMSDKHKVRPSKQLDFIHYQVKLRENPLTFLQELKELVIDNEGYFDRAWYGLHRKYLAIIQAIVERLETSFPDKLNAAIRLLQMNRGEPENHTLGFLLRNSGYRVVADDERVIAEDLKERGLATFTGTKDGYLVCLTANGISYNADKKGDVSAAELLTGITEYLDFKLADVNVLIAQTGHDLAELIDELNEKVGGGAKKPITSLVRSKLKDLILTETIKREGIHPMLDWAEDLIKGLPSPS
ncbi:hypothetical protein [Neolewinella sp.]|uniref:hypothetical protein n=1 Tax=Neolewinella sp. TaxID=2993543 RepID=UPI003B52AE57